MKVWIACLLLNLLLLNQISGEDTGERRWWSSIRNQQSFLSEEFTRKQTVKIYDFFGKFFVEISVGVIQYKRFYLKPQACPKRCLVSPHRPHYMECQCTVWGPAGFIRFDCCVCCGCIVAHDIGVHQLERIVELLTPQECEDLLRTLSRPEENIFQHIDKLSPENNQLHTQSRAKRDAAASAAGKESAYN